MPDEHIPRVPLIDWWARAIRDVGFPVVVACVLLYLLVNQIPLFRESILQLSGTLGSVSRSLDNLANQQDELSDLIRGEKKVRTKLLNKLEGEGKDE